MSDGFAWDKVPLKEATSPSAGANFSYTLGTARRGQLRGLTAKLVTDGNAANRNVFLLITRGADILYRSPSGSNQTATQTNYYQWWFGNATSDGADQTYRTWPLPALFNLKATDDVAITVGAKEAGDQLTIDWDYAEAPT